jgi:hypothetical protein
MQPEESYPSALPDPEAPRAVIPSWSMSAHHEERRALSLLRQTLVQSGVAIDIVESRLGWEPGRLATSLEGKRTLSFGDLVQVLEALSVTPPEFFTRLYSAEAEKTAASIADRRFEQSRQVVRDAVARRTAWKKDKSGV